MLVDPFLFSLPKQFLKHRSILSALIGPYVLKHEHASIHDPYVLKKDRCFIFYYYYYYSYFFIVLQCSTSKERVIKYK